MTHRTISLTLLALLSLFPSRGLAQTPIAGNWDVTVKTPLAALLVKVTLEQDGDKLTGRITSLLGTVPLKGTITADEFKSSGIPDGQDASAEVALNGRVTGDAIAGMAKLGPLGEFPFTGKRSVANAEPPPAPTLPPSQSDVPANVTGNWELMLRIADTIELPASATLQQDGETVTGTVTSLTTAAPAAGTMIGRSIKLAFTAATPFGAVPITMTGELGAEGFSGKAVLVGAGEAVWTGKRVP